MNMSHVIGTDIMSTNICLIIVAGMNAAGADKSMDIGKKMGLQKSATSLLVSNNLGGDAAESPLNASQASVTSSPTGDLSL
jgi:hypothetical protein